tara:strand:+ start:13415 stop:15034 length:1620 start_codon:yes stop_codon:yes gene_type:complete
MLNTTITCYLLPIIPIWLYAEIHYRFRFFPFSLYFKKEPEIIADAPFRIEPNHKLPISILVKDAHRYPIHLKSIEIEITDLQKKTISQNIQIDEHINKLWWYKIFHIDTEVLNENCSISVNIYYNAGKKDKSCINHNLRDSHLQTLTTFISPHQLPGKESGWHWGDIHFHSNYTEDFVEFGSPLLLTKCTADALGLSFVCITDHSYDLDDIPGSWNRSDPELTKWKKSRVEINELNENGLPVLIPGEEVTSSNSHRQNVHTLVLNHPEFIPGSGDSAEKWFKTKSEHTIPEVSEMVNDSGLSIAAHPGMEFSFLERLLLNRGWWEKEDYEVENVHGYQILNGFFDKGFKHGLKLWTAQLLKGRKKFIYAGNDAHGNFNSFRQVKIPMLNLWSHSDQILGKCRTGILIDGTPNIENIISALRKGSCVISNGPLLTITAESESFGTKIGGIIKGDNIVVKLNCLSNPELGTIRCVILHYGEIGSSSEIELVREEPDDQVYTKLIQHNLQKINSPGYIRGILITTSPDGELFRCYTNPIWID